MPQVGQPDDSGPLSQIPGMTYVTPINRPKPAVPLLAVFALLVVVILLGVGVIGYLALRRTTTTTSSPPNVSTMFTAAITKALSTGKVERHLGYSGFDYTLQEDASQITDVRLSGTATRTATNGSASVELYGSLQNTYIKYDSATTTLAPASALNNWLVVRRSGVTPAGVTGRVSQMTTPEYLLLGAYIFGNFSQQQRSTLVDYLSNHPVYQFDANSVQQAVLNNKPVLVYSVSFNADNLSAYNKLVAGMYGMSDANLQALLGTFKYYGTNKVYIDEASKQIVQVEFVINNLQVTQTFAKFDDLTLPAEPTSARIFTQYNPLPSL